MSSHLFSTEGATQLPAQAEVGVARPLSSVAGSRRIHDVAQTRRQAIDNSGTEAAINYLLLCRSRAVGKRNGRAPGV